MTIGSFAIRGAHAAQDRSANLEWFRRLARPRIAYPLLGFAALGYSLVAYELSLARALPMPAPYLRIPDTDYFLWATLFYAPVILAAWLLAAAALYLMTRAFRMRADFDSLLTSTALATGVGTLGTLIPDLVTSPLRALGVINERAWEISISTQGGWFYFTWATLIAYLVLFTAGYSISVKVAGGASWPRSVAIGLAGFIVFQAFELVFIR